MPEKVCATCGRRMTYRKKWRRNWEQVRFCSRACRDRRPDASDEALERAILDLLDARATHATICPSEAARAVGGESWRPLMERARSAGRRLAAAGAVEFRQGGRAVDPSTARGPVRIGRPRKPAA